MKIRLFEVKNILVSLKAFASSFVTGAITLIPILIGMWFIAQGMLVVGRIIQIIVILASFVVWGWLSRKFWKWN